MIALLQRVSGASCTIDGEITAAIDTGLVILLGVQRDDTEAAALRLAERVLSYRIFPDAADRMNIDVRKIGGSLLIVPQFTLVADTRKGNRPGFSRAAPPSVGEALFESFVKACARHHESTVTGQFGADMKIALVNDGPVTIWLEVTPS